MARQNIATEDPIGISSTLEKGASRVNKFVGDVGSALVGGTGGVLSKGVNAVGRTALGASAALSNMINSNGSMRQGNQQSADTFNQTLKDMGGDAVNGISNAAGGVSAFVKNNLNDRVIIDSVSQRLQGGAGGSQENNSNVAGNTGVTPNLTQSTVTPTQIQSNLGDIKTLSPIGTNPPQGSSVAPSPSNSVPTAFKSPISQDGFQTSVNSPSGGRGTISFADGRQLSSDKMNKLGEDIAYNADQSSKDKFAKEAAIVAQRHQDYQDFKDSRAGDNLLDAALASGNPGAAMKAYRMIYEGQTHKDVAKIGADASNTTARIAARHNAFDEQNKIDTLNNAARNNAFNQDKDVSNYIKDSNDKSQDVNTTLSGIISMGKFTPDRARALFGDSDISTPDKLAIAIKDRGITPENGNLLMSVLHPQ